VSTIFLSYVTLLCDELIIPVLYQNKMVSWIVIVLDH